jgi:branched-chain amino acid transport system permease protein
MFIDLLISGLSVGIVYALVAVGYSLVFGVLRILNMAHSSIYAFGANIILVFIGLKMNMPLAVICGTLSTALLAMSFDKYLLRPLRNRQESTMMSMITAIGFNYVIQNVLIAFLTSERRPFPNIFGAGAIMLGGHRVQTVQIYMFLISLVFLAVLMLIVYRTKLGMSMRAVRQNSKAAGLMGINVKRVITITFFISGIYAALAGFLIGSYYEMVFPGMGATVGNKAFASAVLGGIGNLPASILGGLLIGIIETFVTSILGGTYRDAIAFVVLIIVLIFKPSGLFGQQEIVKV